MFRDQVNRWATPLTTGLFLVSLVSGAALFFHIGQATFHGMHEWLSMVLILPFAFHVWKNWLPLTNYLRRGLLWVPLGLSLAAAVVFAVPAATGGAGGNPMMTMARTLGDARIADLAPVLKTTPADLVARLAAAGVTGATPETSIAAASAAAGKESRAVLFAVMAAR